MTLLIIAGVLFTVGGLIMFVHKIIMKNAMEKKLGRKVEDRELTSISAWMDDKGDQTRN